VSTSGAGKWVVTGTVLFGTFVAVMDISVVNVALPHMMGSFGETMSTITWVATAYSIAEIILATMAGWWSTLLGRKRLLLLSFAVFTLGSILAGTSQTFTQMLIYRVIQGIGGGALIPVSQAILRESFPPEEQGIAMAMYGMGVVLAPAVGPVLGGWLTDHYGWPWIFYINIPACLIGMLLIWLFIHDPPYLRRGVSRVDWGGIALLTIGLTGLQIFLERGERENWFESDFIILAAIVTGLTLAILIFWELRVPEPVVNLRILKNIPLTVGSAMGLIFGIALFGSTFVLPQFTQKLLGYPAFEAGLVLLPRAMVLFLVMPIAGRLYTRLDARVLVGIGFVALCISFYDLAHLSLHASFWNIVPMLLLMGAGMPFMFVTLSTVSLSTVRRSDMTDASSIHTLARRIGGNIGYALVATIVSHRQQFHRSHLVEHVTAYTPGLDSFREGISAHLMASGQDPHAAAQGALALTDHLVNRQAEMLAYNDASMVLAWLLVLVIPLILLLPSRRKTMALAQAAAAEE
jgi:DHA2 family multidrug resistance protein